MIRIRIYCGYKGDPNFGETTIQGCIRMYGHIWVVPNIRVPFWYPYKLGLTPFGCGLGVLELIVQAGTPSLAD